MTVTIADAFVEVLRSEGVTHVFGNPGTTELPLLAAVAAAGTPRYVLGLQEGSVVAMADGFARASGGVGVVNLHVAAGLANGMVGLQNARRSRVPLVVTAGQQDRRHLDQDPMLAGDLVGLAATACKRAVEVHHAADLPAVLRRAFKEARSAPAGPVLVSIPVDLLDQPQTEPVPARSAVYGAGVAEGVAEAAAVLRAATRPAIVAGEGIGREGALTEAVALAEALGATVHLQPMYDRLPFPATHPLVAAELPPSNAAIERALAAHDVVLVVGARAFSPHYFSQRRAVPDGVRLLQLDSDAEVVGRNHPVEVGMVGGIRVTLGALAEAVADARSPAGLGDPGAVGLAASAAGAAVAALPPIAGATDAPLTPAAAVAAIVRALPADAIVAEEAVTSSGALRRALRAERADQYQRSSGAGLGWGAGAAVGIKLAAPERPVVGVLGDGAAAYGVQALWTAAHERAGAVFVVLNNREYRAVKQGIANAGGPPELSRVGADLADPPLDWASIARGFGIAAHRAETPDEIAETVASALTAGAPCLVEIPIAGIDAAPTPRH